MSDPEKHGGQPDITYYNVELSSRYSQPHEMRVLVRMVDALQDLGLAAGIDSIWCDSKACAVYTVEARGDMAAELAARIADVLQATAIEEGGGHNGIVVARRGRWLSEKDPYWHECPH